MPGYHFELLYDNRKSATVIPRDRRITCLEMAERIALHLLENDDVIEVSILQSDGTTYTTLNKEDLNK